MLSTYPQILYTILSTYPQQKLPKLWKNFPNMGVNLFILSIIYVKMEAVCKLTKNNWRNK